MAFLMISKKYVNILVKQLFLHFLILFIINFYLKDVKLFIQTSLGILASVTGDSFLLNCYKILDVSD